MRLRENLYVFKNLQLEKRLYLTINVLDVLYNFQEVRTTTVPKKLQKPL